MCTQAAMDVLKGQVELLAEDADLLASAPFKVLFADEDVTGEWVSRLRAIVSGLELVVASHADLPSPD